LQSCNSTVPLATASSSFPISAATVEAIGRRPTVEDGSIWTVHATVAVENDGLVLRLEASHEYLDRLENVVGSHLARFVAVPAFSVKWTRSDNTEGSQQQNA
jgi:hypothetical protein